MNSSYEAYATAFIRTYYQTEPIQISFLGGGFYGRVYLASIDQEPYQVVVKIHMREGFHIQEQQQLTALAKHATIRMPKVYQIHSKDEAIPVDILAMEYIEGVNAGHLDQLPLDYKDQLADQMVQNLIAYHSVLHPQGFGELQAEAYERDWRVLYKKKAYEISHKANVMKQQMKISDEIYEVVEVAYAHFDRIFSEPIETARLIHGDYNTWNILLNKDCTAVAAVIDPSNCCWADSEMDLYQLNNANGKAFGLLDRYKAIMPLSPNFELKNSFYEVFTEIMHYYDSNVAPIGSKLLDQALQLKQQMKLNHLI